jgi:hypothetical protein
MNSARLLRVKLDETEGELYLTVVLDEKTEQDIRYEDVFCGQLDENAVGLVISTVTDIMPEELKWPEHAKVEAWLHRECGADDRFIRDMFSRGNRLFVHHTVDGGEYIVFARRVLFKAGE